MQYPKPLIKGSKIAITAVSAGVPAHLHQRLNIIIKGIEERGFVVVEGKCLRQNNKHVSASAQERADEFMQFLCDESISAVVPPWGGEFAMDILPLLDYEKLKNVQAKWVFGFSDVSTVANALFCKLGWVTVHCANLMDLQAHETDELTLGVLTALAQPLGTQITQQSSTHYQVDSSAFATDPYFILNKTEATQWQISGNRQTRMRGHLVGGCLDILVATLGTEYFDINALHSRFADNGIIFYFENVEMPVTTLKRHLLSLQYKGIFALCNGLLIGRNAMLEDSKQGVSAREVLLEICDTLDIPVFYDVDIGHLQPNMTLFNGAYAEVEMADGKGVLVQSLV